MKNNSCSLRKIEILVVLIKKYEKRDGIIQLIMKISECFEHNPSLYNKELLQYFH